MRLRRYLSLLNDIVQSRRDLQIESFVIRETIPGLSANVAGRFRFWDDSMLEFAELLEERGALVYRVDYAYHYQDRGNSLIFRYDNAPHHPEVATHPHHKHIKEGRVERILEVATTPQLDEVLREINRYLQATS